MGFWDFLSSSKPTKPVVPVVVDMAAIRRERLEAAQRRRAELEARLAEEEILLHEEEERDWLRAELAAVRTARRARRTTTP